ncbi:MAG TPA: hypothetical protein VF681_03035 [Abditibacteriaceae bacterium]|jgi:hypothetical protein
MPGRVWTRDKLIDEIRKLDKQGVDLSPTAIQKSHGALFSSARSRSHFGNWREAIEAAGLDYEDIKRVKQRWSRDEILAQIRKHHENGEDLLDPQFKLRERGLYLAACAHRYFGSWRRAVQAAGIDHEQLREKRIWTKTRILRCIQDLAKEGKPLGWAYVEQHCPGIYRAARRKENFVSWHEALLAAGVTPSANARGRRPNIVREQMAREAAANGTAVPAKAAKTVAKAKPAVKAKAKAR